MGLIYMHDQGVVHGDLKGVCTQTPCSLSSVRLTLLSGKHPDRPQWPRPFSRLQSNHDNSGPVNRYIDMHTGWHGSMDESRTHRPR